MLKRFLSFAVACAAACPFLFAHAVHLRVDVNTADEAALRAVKGIGPARAKAIVDERAAGGPFKDADDLGHRVKGLGGQAVERLRTEGLTLGLGRERSAAPRSTDERTTRAARIVEDGFAYGFRPRAMGFGHA